MKSYHNSLKNVASSVALIKCLRSIKQNAFVASKYPVVIRLEDQLSPNLQATAALNIGNVDSDKEIEEFESYNLYESLIGIHDGKPKGESGKCVEVDRNKVKCLSLSEQELKMEVITHGNEIVRFTLQNLLRVYPKGARITSSNYNPLIGWMHGAQMVAFNMQVSPLHFPPFPFQDMGYGIFRWLMHGMFKANGECGHVIKPDFLLHVGPNNEIFDPRAHMVKTTLKVKDLLPIDLSAILLLSVSSRFFTKLAILFLLLLRWGDKDELEKTSNQRTSMKKKGIHEKRKNSDPILLFEKTMIEDDWSPSWNEVFEYPLSVPELAYFV
ncbi:unnamed protein product [Sphenostylis stenocarpa]|uniref:Phosphoinositide phospholipase C n=1 Tax=Sphenostylis stenocarpa TaxID=92480 RepID=A0AA86RP41_9FABA|nr:unnamed protein product [Sphenostylis stenocarpa]